jgi:hypothetical protein
MNSTEPKKKENYLKKFKLHAGEIDPYFKYADLTSELDDVISRLNILVRSYGKNLSKDR